jgi:hypothetical protein
VPEAEADDEEEEEETKVADKKDEAKKVKAEYG